MASVYRHEFLDSLPGFDLARVDVALRIGGDGINEMKHAGHASVVADRAHGHAGAPVDDPDLVVGAVSDEHEILLGIGGEGEVEHRAARAELVAARATALGSTRWSGGVDPVLRDERALT